MDELNDNFDNEINGINGNTDEGEDFSKTTDTKIRTESKDLPIREFLTMKQEGDLVIRPEYQRKFVMDVKLCSRLIESILMDVPIPVIYLAEGKDGKYSVIDGQQRLTAFLSFLEGSFPNKKEFALIGLKVLSELNRKTFKDLDKVDQRKIQTTALRTIVIKKESDEDIKFNIFERLNTGSIRLNEDELRNTIYRGSYVKLLAELEENETFHKLVRNERAKQRMIYRGMILRFFALASSTYINYRPSMKQFCNRELIDNQNMRPEKQKEYKDKFLKSIELVNTIFGDKAFRRFNSGDIDNKHGKWNTSQLNMSLYDIQMCGFVLYEKNKIISRADAIREAMIKLMTTNETFINSIEIGTSDKTQVAARFKIWLDVLEKIVGSPENELRIFPYSLKKRLFEDNPQCQICGQQIRDIDDAEVDHITPFSKGGRTNIENAQLAHRFCNRQKGNQIIISQQVGELSQKIEPDIIYTEEDKISVANEFIKNLYLKTKKELLLIGDFEIKINKHYITFSNKKTNIVDIHIQNKALKIWLNAPKGYLKNTHGIVRDVSKVGHWGNGDYEISLKSEDYLRVFLDLVCQTYAYHNNR